MTTVSGDPDQMFGGVRAGDVARAIRDLEPGFHSVVEVRSRWLQETGELISPRVHQVTRIVTGLGLTKYIQDGVKGWHIDPASLARRWPRLPWTD